MENVGTDQGCDEMPWELSQSENNTEVFTVHSDDVMTTQTVTIVEEGSDRPTALEPSAPHDTDITTDMS